MIDDIEALLTENRIFKQRTVDIGWCHRKTHVNWGFTGPMLRRSGVAWDLRKTQPYDSYDDMDFDIPVGKNGDCYRALSRARWRENASEIRIVHSASTICRLGLSSRMTPRFRRLSRGDMKHRWKR